MFEQTVTGPAGLMDAVGAAFTITVVEVDIVAGGVCASFTVTM